MKFKQFYEATNPLESFVAYHQTSLENAMSIKKARRFSLKKSTQGIVWFTTDVKSLQNHETGAGRSGGTLKLLVTIKNPAGWEEYGKLFLSQLKHEGYDGVILPHDKSAESPFDGFVFDPKQIKILGLIDENEL